MTKTTVYMCSDATLTYGPYGGLNKIIKAALPVCVVDGEDEARRLIALTASMDHKDPADPYYAKPIADGYGPERRHRFSLPIFKRNDVESLFVTQKWMERVRDTLRAGESTAPLFEEAMR